MTKKRILRVKQQTVKTQEPRLIKDIINDLFNGQTPFARARRHRSGRAWTGQAGTESTGAGRTWTGLYPNTELGVDLKLVRQEQGRMELGEMLHGMLVRDGEDHFNFTEDTTERRKAERRNPSIYEGRRINVKRRDDGTVYPTFKRTKSLGAGEFADYAVSTAYELLMVAGKHEAALALAEIEGFDLREVFAADGGLGEENFGGMSGFASGRGLGEEEDFGEE